MSIATGPSDPRSIAVAADSRDPATAHVALSGAASETNQSFRRILIMRALLLLLSSAVALLAADPFLGSWKLNAEQSRYPQGAPRELTVTWALENGVLTVSAQGIAPDGQPIRRKYQPVYDGKEQKNPGNYPWDSVRNTQVDEHTRIDYFTKAGKPFGVEKRLISADGKTMRVESWFEERQGRIEILQVFDRVR